MIVVTKKGKIKNAYKIILINNVETATIDVAILVRETKGKILKFDVPMEDIYEVVEGENNG